MIDSKHTISDIKNTNKLSIKALAQMLNMLCEGSSMRSVLPELMTKSEENNNSVD